MTDLKKLLLEKETDSDNVTAQALEREILVPKENAPKITNPIEQEEVIIALKTVFDPEINVNIYDLGLIYRIEIKAEGEVDIIMTLTSPLCPVADEMPHMVADSVLALEGVSAVRVKIVWDPPWDLSMISDEGRFLLDMM